MDRQDYDVTVRETFEAIDRAIEELALDGVEPYPQKHGLRLMFEDGTFITLTPNAEEQTIEVIKGEILVPFYWDAVEEHWYARSDERPLLAALSTMINDKLGTTVTLPDLL